MKLKICLVEKTHPESYMEITSYHMNSVRTAGKDVVVIKISEENIEKELFNTEILLIQSSMLSQIDFSKCSALKWIHVTSAGVNNLPSKLINSKIIITNSSGVHPFPISEQIFAYLLIFARSMHTSLRNQLQRKWDEKGLSVFEIHGKTIGIIGVGNIGEEVARLSKAFQMNVLGVVRKKRSSIPYVDQLFTLDKIDDVLTQSDFVVNCLPGTSETKHLYTLEKFKMMKKTAYFINIGRGFSVLEKDLITALEKKIISGAGLDVFEEEPLPNDSPLWNMEHVLITPHHAGNNPHYMDRVIDIFCENLKHYLKGEKMLNIVDKKLGY